MFQYFYIVMESMWTYKQRVYTSIRKLFEALWQNSTHQPDVDMEVIENIYKRKSTPIIKQPHKRLKIEN